MKNARDERRAELLFGSVPNLELVTSSRLLQLLRQSSLYAMVSWFAVSSCSLILKNYSFVSASFGGIPVSETSQQIRSRFPGGLLVNPCPLRAALSSISKSGAIRTRGPKAVEGLSIALDHGRPKLRRGFQGDNSVAGNRSLESG